MVEEGRGILLVTGQHINKMEGKRHKLHSNSRGGWPPAVQGGWKKPSKGAPGFRGRRLGRARKGWSISPNRRLRASATPRSRVGLNGTDSSAQKKITKIHGTDRVLGQPYKALRAWGDTRYAATPPLSSSTVGCRGALRMEITHANTTIMQGLTWLTRDRVSRSMSRSTV